MCEWQNCVLTPNKNEFARLVKTLAGHGCKLDQPEDEEKKEEHAKTSILTMCAFLEVRANIIFIIFYRI